MRPAISILEELAEHVTRIEAGDKPPHADGYQPRPVPQSRPPLNVETLDLLDECKQVTASWVQLIQDETGEEFDWPADTTQACCKWLQNRSEWAQTQPWYFDMDSELRALHKRTSRHLGIRPPYRPSCRYCGHPVQWIDPMSQPVDDWEQAAYGQCRGCRTLYNPGAEIAALGRVQDFTITQLAHQLGVARSTMRNWIRTWCADGSLTPTGKQGNAPTYNLEAVLSLTEASRV